MKSKLTVLMVCFVLSFSQFATAAHFQVGVLGGTTSFSEDFSDSSHFGVRVVAAAKEGLVLDATGSYIEADGESEGDSSIKIAPVMIGMNYMIPVKAAVRPFAGVMVGASLLSSSFDDPAISYGYKAGFLANVGRDLVMTFEASKLFVDSSIDGVSIEPLNFSFGLGMKFKGKKKQYENEDPIEQMQPVRRPKPRGPRNRRGY